MPRQQNVSQAGGVGGRCRAERIAAHLATVSGACAVKRRLRKVLVKGAHARVELPVGDRRQRRASAAFWELASSAPQVDEGIMLVFGARLGTGVAWRAKDCLSSLFGGRGKG